MRGTSLLTEGTAKKVPYLRYLDHTTAEWTSLNPILETNQLGVDTDTREAKIGDGITNWLDLRVLSDGDSAPVSPPAAPTNLDAPNDASATISWTPPAGATTIIVTVDGQAIAPLAGTATSFLDTSRSPGTHTYGVRGHNSAGDGPEVTVDVDISAPGVPDAPASMEASPNGGLVQLVWSAVLGVSSYQVLRDDGSGFNLVAVTSVTTFTEPDALDPGSYSYQVKAVNSAGAGAAVEKDVLVPSFSGPLDVTSRGSGTAAAGSNTDESFQLDTPFTPADGSVLVVVGELSIQDPGIAFTIDDDFGDTGGTEWSEKSGVVSTGDFVFYKSGIWTRVVGTGASSGNITFTRLPGGSAFWSAKMGCGEVANASSDVPLHFNSNSDTGAVDVSTDLGAVPASTSALFVGGLSRHNNDDPVAGPDGFTELFNDSAGGGSATMYGGFLVGSGTRALTIGTEGNVNNAIVAIEIGQAVGPGGGGLAVPNAPQHATSSVVAQAGGQSRITLTFDPMLTADGFDVWLNGTDEDHKIAWPRNSENGSDDSWVDPTLRDDGTYQFYVAGYNGAGVGALSPVLVTVDNTAGSGGGGGTALQNYLGASGEALSIGSGWQDGTNVQTFESEMACPAKFVTVWSNHSQGASQNLVNDWVTLSATGQKLHGHTPVFTVTVGMGDYSNDSVNAGTHDAEIDAYATTVETQVTAGKLTNPIFRIGWEFTLTQIATRMYGIQSPGGGATAAAMDSFRNAVTRHITRMRAICPSAKLEVCGIDVDYAYDRAIPWAVADYVGSDVYDDWQGPGSAKAGAGAYATYTSPSAAWQGKWYHNSDPANPSGGSNAWLWNLCISNGKPFAISEWGLMARLALPSAGGGDNPYFITQMAALMATGHIHHACYFQADATFNNQLQDHIIWRRDGGGHLLFPNAYATFKTLFD